MRHATRHIKALGEAPSPRVGAFYGKAMAIADLAERITFLNRGEGWVVRKLREMLPRVRNDRLHADLTEMLRTRPILPSRTTLSPVRHNRCDAPCAIEVEFVADRSRTEWRQDVVFLAVNRRLARASRSMGSSSACPVSRPQLDNGVKTQVGRVT